MVGRSVKRRSSKARVLQCVGVKPESEWARCPARLNTRVDKKCTCKYLAGAEEMAVPCWRLNVGVILLMALLVSSGLGFQALS